MTNALILIVEDDAELANWISQFLLENGFRTKIIDSGDAVVEEFKAINPDLVLLDIHLPGKNGFEVCRQLRTFSHQPIIMVTAKDQELDEVRGLELGANDYITKPVKPSVLLARIKAQLREGQEQIVAGENYFRFGALQIDLNTRTVTLDQQPVFLSSGEFDLLWILATNAGKEVRREDLIKTIRGFDYNGIDRTVDVRISHLRKKLQDSPSRPKKIKTIWGKGYLFVKKAW